MNEMEINFKDMFLKVLLKWRMFLCSAIVMGILFGVFGILKGTSSSHQTQEGMEVVTMESLQGVLSEPMQKNVELSADNYLTLKEFINAKETYMKQSIRMQIDYKHVQKIALTYRVESKRQAIYPIMSVANVTDDIIELYLGKILNYETYQQISSEIGWDIDAEYVEELFSFEKGENELFTIFVLAHEREMCEKIVAIVKEKMNSACEVIKEEYDEHELILVNEIRSESEDTGFLKERLNKIDEIVMARSQMNAIDDAMSAEELAYFDALVNGIHENNVTQPLEEGYSVITNVNTIYIVLGILVGMFLAFCYIIVKYVCSTYLRNSDEMKQLTGANVLGEVCLEGKPKYMSVVDFRISRAFDLIKCSKDERMELVCSNIRVAMNKCDLQKVCFVTTCDSIEIKTLIEELSNKFTGDVFEVYAATDVLNNSKMLENMLMADSVVIVEKENTSKRINIKKITELCVMHRVDILGGVSVKSL